MLSLHTLLLQVWMANPYTIGPVQLEAQYKAIHSLLSGTSRLCSMCETSLPIPSRCGQLIAAPSAFAKAYCATSICPIRHEYVGPAVALIAGRAFAFECHGCVGLAVALIAGRALHCSLCF